MVKDEREVRIEGLLGFLSQAHAAEIKPVRLEMVSRQEAVTQRSGMRVLN